MEQGQRWLLFSPCSLAAHLTPTPAKGQSPSPATTQPQDTSPSSRLHPKMGCEFMPWTRAPNLAWGKALFASLLSASFCWVCSHLLPRRCFPSLQRCLRLPVQCHLRMSRRVFSPPHRARVAGGLLWVPGCPIATSALGLLSTYGTSRCWASAWSCCDFPPNPASHNRPSKPTRHLSSASYSHREGRLKLSCFISQTQPGRHTARYRGSAGMC